MQPNTALQAQVAPGQACGNDQAFSHEYDAPCKTSKEADEGGRILVHQLLGVIANLNQASALNGREIGEAVGVDSREVQKVLPFLAKRGRISREKRVEEGRGNFFYYWMNGEQRVQFEMLVERRRRYDCRTLSMRIAALQLENEKLENELAEMRRIYRGLVEANTQGSTLQTDVAVTCSKKFVPLGI